MALRENYALPKENLLLLGVGFVVILIGCICMIGGGSTDGVSYNPEIFSPMRITVAPIILVIGFFFGVFIIDVVYSANLVVKIRQYAVEHDVIVKYETLKSQIRHAQDEAREKTNFLFPFKGSMHISEYLKSAHAAVEEKRKKRHASK